MKEFDAFERSIKDSLEGYSEMQPSKKLWWKISASMLWLGIFKKAIYPITGAMLVIIVALGWGFSEEVRALAKSGNNSHNQNSTILEESVAEQLAFKQADIVKVDILADQENQHRLEVKNDNMEAGSIDYSKTDNTNVLESEPVIVSVVETNLPQESKANNTKITSALASNTLNSTGSITSSKFEIIAATSSNELEENFLANNQSTKMSEIQPNALDAHTTIIENIDISLMPLFGFKPTYSLEPLPKVQTGLVMNYMRSKYSKDYEIFMGPNLNSAVFQLDKNNTSDPSLNKSSSSVSYHFGANINLYYKNWFVRSGINYSQINEKLSFENNAKFMDSITYFYTLYSRTYLETILGYSSNIIPGMDSIPIIGITVIENSSQHSFVEYDSVMKTNQLQYRYNYSSINIPLMVGRKFNYKSFVFDVAGGVSWAHILQNEIQLFDQQSGEILGSWKNSDKINKDIFNGVLAVGIGFRMTDQNTVFIRPEFQYNINSIFDESLIDKHKLYQFRFSAGIRYNIN